MTVLQELTNAAENEWLDRWSSFQVAANQVSLHPVVLGDQNPRDHELPL